MRLNCNSLWLGHEMSLLLKWFNTFICSFHWFFISSVAKDCCFCMVSCTFRAVCFLSMQSLAACCLFCKIWISLAIFCRHFNLLLSILLEMAVLNNCVFGLIVALGSTRNKPISSSGNKKMEEKKKTWYQFVTLWFLTALRECRRTKRYHFLLALWRIESRLGIVCR